MIKGITRLSQVDWKTEIVEPIDTDKVLVAQKASQATEVWVNAQNIFTKMFSEEVDEIKKANIVRIIEYFLSKFLFWHSAVYDRDGDLIGYLKSQKELSLLLKAGKRGLKSELPLSKLLELENVLTGIVNESRDRSREKYPKEEDILKEFQKHDKNFYVFDKKYGDRYSFRILRNDIIYETYIMKDNEDYVAKVAEEVKDLNNLILKYGDLISRIHTHLKSKNIDGLYVMEGGGAQHQAFFGNCKRYIGILYLGMKNEAASKEMHTMVMESLEADALVSDMHVKGVKVLTHKQHWEPAFKKLNNKK